MNETSRRLVQRTREMLLQRARTVRLRDIRDATGVDEDFLTRFQAETVRHPSVHKVIAVYEYMAGRKLEL